MMRKTLIAACALALVALATAPVDAHIQVGNNSSDVCVSNDHPNGNQNHIHIPGGATDQCQPPVPYILSLLED